MAQAQSTAPTGVIATAFEQQVNLSWQPVPGAGSYNVYRGAAAGAEAPAPVATGVTTTSYSDTSASDGHTYYYKVAAVLHSAVGAKSAEVSASPGSVPLPSPQLRAIAGSGKINLYWSAVRGAASYDIFRDGVVYRTARAATSFVDAPLESGAVHSYAVAAVNASGAGPESSTETATAAGSPAPQSGGLVPATGHQSPSRIWNPVRDDIGLEIYRVITSSAGLLLLLLPMLVLALLHALLHGRVRNPRAQALHRRSSRSADKSGDQPADTGHRGNPGEPV